MKMKFSLTLFLVLLLIMCFKLNNGVPTTYRPDTAENIKLKHNLANDELNFNNDNEEEKCSLITCQNNGTCIIKEGKAVCECTEGYTGNLCQTDCDTNKCKRTGCNCCPGYGVKPGDVFSRETCKKCNCGKSFNCKFKTVFFRTRKTCLCPTGYSKTSDFCTADCNENPCMNGGTCTVKNNEVVCVCENFHTGEFCEKKDTTDPCVSNPCKNGGTCVFSGGKVKCQCELQFEGNTCEKEKCPLTCQNKGKCIINAGKAICNCPDEYTGETCETSKCSLKKCQSGGVCVIENGKAVCDCPERYTGDLCEAEKCSLRCRNRGNCIIKNGRAVCNCTDE